MHIGFAYRKEATNDPADQLLVPGPPVSGRKVNQALRAPQKFPVLEQYRPWWVARLVGVRSSSPPTWNTHDVRQLPVLAKDKARHLRNSDVVPEEVALLVGCIAERCGVQLFIIFAFLSSTVFAPFLLHIPVHGASTSVARVSNPVGTRSVHIYAAIRPSLCDALYDDGSGAKEIWQSVWAAAAGRRGDTAAP